MVYPGKQWLVSDSDSGKEEPLMVFSAIFQQKPVVVSPSVLALQCGVKQEHSEASPGVQRRIQLLCSISQAVWPT
jgi:hypothetical protein